MVEDRSIVDIDMKTRRFSDADVTVPPIVTLAINSPQEEDDSRQSVSLSSSPSNKTGDLRLRSSSELLTLSPSAEREKESLIESKEHKRSVSQSSCGEMEAVEIRQHEIKTILPSHNRMSLGTLLSMTGFHIYSQLNITTLFLPRCP